MGRRLERDAIRRRIIERFLALATVRDRRRARHRPRAARGGAPAARGLKFGGRRCDLRRCDLRRCDLRRRGFRFRDGRGCGV